MRDPVWIDEAAATLEALCGDLTARVDDWRRDDYREIVRAVLLVQDKHDCRGPADR